VAAREHQLQPLVGKCAHVLVLVCGELGEACKQLRLAFERPFTANAVDGTVACGCEDPRAGIRRLPVAVPAFERDRECVLECVLGEIEVAEDAREDRE
jgi:hypothetical protein